MRDGDRGSTRLDKLVRKELKAACRIAAHCGDGLPACGGVRSGYGICGTRSIPDCSRRHVFIRISGAGLRESHVHDVIITREAPNYRLE